MDRSNDFGDQLQMNQPEHTKELQNQNLANLPRFVISIDDGSIHGEDFPENLELVRRTIACFNACEGISTADLESGIIKDMQRVLAEIKQIDVSELEIEPATFCG